MSGSFTQLHPELAALLPGDLHACCVTSVHRKGERLFVAGSKPTHMVFIAGGEVILERHNAQGGAVVLQRVRHGFVGEASLRSARYHCDGTVIATSDVIRIPIARVRLAMDTDPVFAGRWVGMLNREVQRLRLRCERMSLHKVQERLTHLVETEGTNGSYPLPAGLKSLAAELGVTHEALYRCATQMQREGLLSRDERGLSLRRITGPGPAQAARLATDRQAVAPPRPVPGATGS